MAEAGSISILLKNLQDGDEQALAALHRRSWPRIVQMARRRLVVPLRSVDEEDVAQEAFWGFVRTVRDGRAHRLTSRHDLFALLTHIVVCKAATHVERHLSAKRGAGQVLGESALNARCNASPLAGLQNVPGHEREPFEEAALVDCYHHYVAMLPESLRSVAELYVAGATNGEIASQLGCVDRTVERKLALIRSRWQELADAELST